MPFITGLIQRVEATDVAFAILCVSARRCCDHGASVDALSGISGVVPFGDVRMAFSRPPCSFPPVPPPPPALARSGRVPVYFALFRLLHAP